MSPLQQADYVVRTLRHVQRQYPWVTRVYWYTERDQRTGDAHQDGFGLLRRDLRAKPAYTALAAHLATRPSPPAPPRVVRRDAGSRAPVLRAR